MSQQKQPPEPDYEVEIIEDSAPDDTDETEAIETEGDPHGDNFA